MKYVNIYVLLQQISLENNSYNIYWDIEAHKSVGESAGIPYSNSIIIII